MNSKLYVNEIYASYNSIKNEKKFLEYPDLEVIREIMNDIKQCKIEYLEISNTDLYVSINIFAEKGLYYIGIVDNETGENYYYCNDTEPTNELVSIAGNLFRKDMICNDFDILVKIVEIFCKSGERLKDVNWICEEI